MLSIQDESLQDGSWIGWPKSPPSLLLPKIGYTYYTKMRLTTVIPYLKEIKRYTNHMANFFRCASTPLLFHQILVIFGVSWNIDKHCLIIYLFYFLDFIEFLEVISFHMIAILAMSAKLVSPNLFKTMIFWSKCYEIIICLSLHLQNFVTWFKLQFRYGHVTKIW